MTKKETIIVVLMACLNFTHILDFMIMMPLGNYLMPDLGVSAMQFSTLVAIYSISAFVSGLVIAMFIDRFDRKLPLFFAYIGFLAGTIACGFANSYYLLLAARTVAGLFGGIIGAQVFAIIADLFVYARRGRAMGIVMGGFAGASILGVPISLQLTNMFSHNWHIPFLLIGGVGIILAPLILRIVPSMKGHILHKDERPSSSRILLATLKDGSQRAALVFSGLLMMGHFVIIPFINPFLEFNKGFSRQDTPMIYFVGGISSLVAAVYLGRLADRVGKLNVFSVSVFLSLFMVVIITNMPSMMFAVVLLLFAAWFTFATGRVVTAQSMVTEVVRPEQRGSFMSINGSVQQLGSGIAALMAGAIVTTEKSGRIVHYDWLGYVSIIILVVALVLGRYLFANLDSKFPGVVPEAGLEN